MATMLAFGADWPHISRLLDEVLDLPFSARAGWLSRLATADARHRDVLHQLLEAQADGEWSGFLETLPPLPLPPASASERGCGLASGHMVGPYRLLRELGRGGMGSVWLAERADGLVKRRVALKLPHAVWGESFSRRLARERDILAALEHPHIARLYDTGLDDRGRPWIAMEYVAGEPIDAWCRDRDLSVPARLALLLQVLAAVGHAHQRLVVHRDLKPPNILVTQDGQVKLLDFGIAQLMQDDSADGTVLTEEAGRALTIAYASPEQIRGEPLGTASDVYSLGVVAYELLAQQRPYRIDSDRDPVRAIAQVHPRRVSEAAPTAALRNALRGDLDAVLGRALEKEVARRYPSAAALAQDLERHLAGEPVQALPASRRYRMTKFVQRHRAGVAMASALALSVVAGSAVSLWQAHEARLQAREARRQGERATAELVQREAALELYDETLMDIATQAADDPVALQLPQAVQKAMLAKLDEFLARPGNTPEKVSGLLEAVTTQLHDLNDLQASMAMGNRYLAHLREHGGDPRTVLNAFAMQGLTLCSLHRIDECEAVRLEGLARVPTAGGDADLRLRRFELMLNLAEGLVQRGKREEARRLLADAQRETPNLASNEEVAGDVDFALARFWAGFDETRSLAHARRADEEYERRRASVNDRIWVLAGLGYALLADGQAAASETALRKALSLATPGFGRRSDIVTQWWTEVADAVALQGRYAEARDLVEQQAAAVGPAPGAANERLLLAGRLSIALLAGDIGKASSLAPPADSPMLGPEWANSNAASLLQRAQVLLFTDHAIEARDFMDEVQARWVDAGKPSDSWMRMQAMRVRTQLAAGDLPAARATAQQLLTLFAAQDATAGSGWREANEMLALACARQGDRPCAAQALAAAEAVAVRFRSPVQRAESALDRAESLVALGRVLEARRLADGALADLQGQAAASPRLKRARQLTGTTQRARSPA